MDYYSGFFDKKKAGIKCKPCIRYGPFVMWRTNTEGKNHEEAAHRISHRKHRRMRDAARRCQDNRSVFQRRFQWECQLINKRGAWMAQVPTTIPIRKSDDALKFHCETKDGRMTVGSIPSEMGGKIIAGAALIDDAITDIHRRYPPGFVIPVAQAEPKL